MTKGSTRLRDRWHWRFFLVGLLITSPTFSLLLPCPTFSKFLWSTRKPYCRGGHCGRHGMVLTPTNSHTTSAADHGGGNSNRKRHGQNKLRRKYKRKRIPETEKELKQMKKELQAEYEQMVVNSKGRPSIWSFESLFPEPVLDKETINRDLFSVREQDKETTSKQRKKSHSGVLLQKMRSSFYGGSSMMRIWREPKLSSAYLPYDPPNGTDLVDTSCSEQDLLKNTPLSSTSSVQGINAPIAAAESMELNQTVAGSPVPSVSLAMNGTRDTISHKVNRDMTRMVEDRVYGYRRMQMGEYEYDTSLMGDGAVQFRDGIRLGKPLPVNVDRLTHFAKKELQHGRVEEAQELYAQAWNIDPHDGRPYLGLSRCAQRRRDFKLAKEYLRAGIANSGASPSSSDRGSNPYLLQALGCLEERLGSLSEAEACYIAAAKAKPSHAAAWVSLAQLRTRKLGQNVNAGRVCYQTAERELKRAGVKPSSYVYTAWASLEYRKGGDGRRARTLFEKALKVDPRCSAAWLQLGVMEADSQNWEEAQACFDTVLKFDQRNARVLQAYALMETKRPDGKSRRAIDLFERAMKCNPRDAGVLQPYALYVAELGDIKSARDLLRRATEIDKRHSAVWQAWGVMETRLGNADEARKIFQQGIWACARLAGGQSGGYRCARLWQAWGVLEALEGDHAGARRCFSRALDADSRNIAAITAWAQMEEGLGNVADARSIFERALNKFSAGSVEKVAIWRSFEQMEQRLGNAAAAQQVYRRSMREAITSTEESLGEEDSEPNGKDQPIPTMEKVLKKSTEVEVSRWDGGSLGGEVWLNDRAIESKVPFDMKKRRMRPMGRSALLDNEP